MAAPDVPTRERIGPYRIVARVGAGGMGEVFKAWDPRLERDVAIKLLHPEMAGDADRQRRLLTEGRAASALNHPNILRVYDADVDGDSYYLVSEWLEGNSLRQELSRGALPLKRLLDLAVQIADGLAAAHAMGIVHRDIKPENVMLARDGTARIVDFGLARADSLAPGQAGAAGASTVTMENGLSGTPAYMSPEQARGTQGDFRSDQFSFGALIYELATGRHAFRRDTMADTLAAVLHDEPKPIALLNPRIPAACRWIIEQCLAKDAADRYAATEDLARELRRLRDRLLEAVAEPEAGKALDEGRRGWPTAAAAVAALVAGLLIGLPIRPQPAPALKFLPFATASAYEGEPAWSADGTNVAYVGDVDGVLQVFVKRVDDALSRQVTRTRFDAQRPFWSPNGQLLYFISQAGAGKGLWSVGVAGGAPELIAEDVVQATISPDGSRMALVRVDPAYESQLSLWWSSPVGAVPHKEMRPPFDRALAITAQAAFSRDGQLLIWMSRATQGQQFIGPTGTFQLFDAAGGPPREILTSLTGTSNLAPFGWLPDNRHILISRTDGGISNQHLWIADTQSAYLRQVTATHTNETAPATSPSGAHIAYATDEVDFDLVLLAPDGSSRKPLLATARNEFAPTWAQKGDQFAFVTDRSGALEIWTRSRDGQWERPIVSAGDFGGSVTESIGSLAFSPDGAMLAYQRSNGGRFEVWLSPTTGGTPNRLVDPAVSIPYQDSPAWSPDGSWLSYTDMSKGAERAVLKKIRVGSKDSVELADNIAAYSQTRWSPDGQWILSQTIEGLIRVPADGGKAEVIGTEAYMDFTWAPDSRHVFALIDSETAGHFALVEIDSTNGQTRSVNPDLGPIPIANQPIRGFSFLAGQGFLTSLASARSDIWLLDGIQLPGNRLLRWFRR